MTEDTEHDEGDEAVGAPLPGDTLAPDEQDAEDAEQAEAGNGEAGAGESEQVAEAKPLTEKEIDRALKRAGTATKTYRAKIAEIFGDDALGLEPCPRCLPYALGHYWQGDTAKMTPEQLVAVKASIGEDVLPVYKADPHRRKCTGCDGWGRTATDSHVANEDVVKCEDCDGRGWRDSRRPASVTGLAPAPLPVTNGPAPLPPIHDDPRAEPDPFGTPPGAPYYGVLLHLRPEGWEREVAAWKVAQGVG